MTQTTLRRCAVCGTPANPRAKLGQWICGKTHTPQEVEEAIQRGKEERDAAAAVDSEGSSS